MMTPPLLNNQSSCAKMDDNIVSALPPTVAQLEKFIRRIRALTDGRHEIILTVQGGVQDWTVRSIGKVEK